MSGIPAPTINASPADWVNFINLINEGFASYKQIGIEIIERRLIIKKGSRFCFRKKFYCVYDDEELSIPELPSTTDIYFLYLNYNEDENSFYFTVSVMEPPLALTQEGWMRGNNRRLICILRYYKTKLIDYIDEKQIKNPAFSMLNLTPGNDRLRTRLQGFFNFTLNGAGGGGGGNEGERIVNALFHIGIFNRGSKGGNGGQVKFFTYIDEPVNMIVGYGGGGGPSAITIGYDYDQWGHPHPITRANGPAVFNQQIGKHTIVGGSPIEGKTDNKIGEGSGGAPGGVTLIQLLESNILLLAQAGAGGGGGSSAGLHGAGWIIGGDAPMGQSTYNPGTEIENRSAGSIDFWTRQIKGFSYNQYSQKWYNRLTYLIHGEIKYPEGGRGEIGHGGSDPGPSIDGGNGGNGAGAAGGAVSQNGVGGNIFIERWA
jgi:hypothetical protein